MGHVSPYSDLYSPVYEGLLSPDPTVEIAWTDTPLTGSPTWTDVTSRVRRLDVDRSYDPLLRRFQAGRATIVLDNLDRALEPGFADSPYYPNVKSRRQVRITVESAGTTYPRFRGVIDRIVPEYGYNGLDATTTIECVDLTGVLAEIDLQVPYVREVLADSPLAYFRLDDSGTADSLGNVIAADSSGNNRFGVYNGPTLYRQPDPITDDQDGAVTFDGVDDHILCNPVPMSSTFTVELWFKGNPAADGRFIHQEGIGASGVTVDFSVFMVASTGVINFQFGQATGSTWQCTSGVGFDDDEWHHLVGVVTGSSIALLIDSVDVTTAPNTTGVPQFATTPVLYVGRGASPIAPQYWAGSLCEIALYPTNLSAARVTDHYDARTAGLGDGTQTRIARAAEYAGIPTALQDLDGGGSLLTGGGNWGSLKALEAMREASVTEAGALYVSGAGKLTFLGRSAPHGGVARCTTSQVTFTGSGGGGTEFTGDPSFSNAASDLANVVRNTRRNGGTTVVRDEASITENLERTRALSTVSSTEAESRSRASWELALLSGTAGMRCRSIGFVAEVGNAAAVLGRELWDRVTVTWNPPGAGANLSQESLVVGIKDRWEPAQYRVVLTLDPTDALPAWRIGIVGSSELGTTTRLFY